MVNRYGVRRIGQVAKLPAARAELRQTRAFGSGTVLQGRCRRQGREGGLEVDGGWNMRMERVRWREM